MPTYQYRCEQCGEKFAHAEHLAEHETAHPNFPKCGSENVQHFSTPFVAKRPKKVEIDLLSVRFCRVINRGRLPPRCQGDELRPTKLMPV